MEPIRILHENVIMDPGGIETQLMRIYRNIDRTKIQFDFLVHRKEKGAYDDEIKSLGGKIYYAEKFNPFHHIKYVKSMKRFFENHKEYKIMIAHAELALWPLIVAKQNKIPVRICYSHNGCPNASIKRIIMWFERLFLKKYCTEMFAVSELAANYTFGKKCVKKKEVKIIKNGIIVDDYAFNEEKRQNKRKELCLENKFVVGHIGRFMEQKNHMFLLEIFNEIKKTKSNSHLILVGEGRLKEKIEKKIKELKLENDVTLLGRRMDVNDLVMAMDVMLLPSFYEGFPNVAIEAQAASLPIYMSTAITKEANFTEFCTQIDLNKGSLYWAKTIINKIDCFERKDMSREIREKGHSVIDTVKWYEDFYLEKCK